MWMMESLDPFDSFGATDEKLLELRRSLAMVSPSGERHNVRMSPLEVAFHVSSNIS